MKNIDVEYYKHHHVRDDIGL